MIRSEIAVRRERVLGPRGVRARNMALAALQQQLTLTEKRRDTWKRAAKGGGWPRRAAKRVVTFAIDAAITSAALCDHCR